MLFQAFFFLFFSFLHLVCLLILYFLTWPRTPFLFFAGCYNLLMVVDKRFRVLGSDAPILTPTCAGPWTSEDIT